MFYDLFLINTVKTMIYRNTAEIDKTFRVLSKITDQMVQAPIIVYFGKHKTLKHPKPVDGPSATPVLIYLGKNTK